MLSVEGKVKARLLKRLITDSDAPYNGKNLHITAVASRTPNEFPTLSFESEENEIGEDLEGIEMVGISSMVQLKGFSDKSLQDSKNLVGYAGDVMKSMGYTLMEKRTLSDSKPFCEVTRYQRNVGSGDFLYQQN